MNTFIASQIAQFPQLEEPLTRLNTFSNKKLWHQFSEELESIAQTAGFTEGQILLNLYQNFVQSHQDSLNGLSLVLFAIEAAKQIPDLSERLAFVESFLTATKDVPAQILCKVSVAFIKHLLADHKGCKELIDTSRTELDAFEGVPNIVHSQFFFVCLQYYKSQGAKHASSFFSSALLYLSYTPLDQIPSEARVQLAEDVGLASLIGTKQYNFGEFLQHPVVKVLEGTTHAWLGEMLFAFNSGNIDAFNALLTTHKPNQAVLRENERFLCEKIRLMALVEMVFKRASTDRNIAFADIGSVCQVGINHVEHLLMKAMSIKLIKGSIDQVQQTAAISWVSPRVLNKDQLEAMRDRFAAWSAGVKDTQVFLENSFRKVQQTTA